MRKLKVGLVGMGGLQRGTGYGLLFNRHSRTEVTAICDVDGEALENARVIFGLNNSQCFKDFDEFVKNDLDIVFIGTPIPFHADQSIKALESGKNVLSEVTAANNISDCERIVRTVRRTGKKYMMAENYYYYDYIQEWKRMIDEEKLGKLFYAEADYIGQIRRLLKDPKTGKLLWRAERPPIHYSSHNLGPLLLILNDRVKKATASGAGKSIMPDVGVGAIDMQVALFETERGVTIKILRSQVAPRKPPIEYYCIYGTKGFVENGRNDVSAPEFHLTEGLVYIENEDEAAREVKCHSSTKELDEFRKGGLDIRTNGLESVTAEWSLVKDFIDCIDRDTEPIISAEKAFDITVPGLIAHEAAMNGNIWLDVPHI